MSRVPRILVAMSGGVDSSVAAALLHEQGFDVLGVFMRMGPAPQDAAGSSSVPRLPVLEQESEAADRGCCSAIDAADARRVASRLGIPFYALNFEREFGHLIDYFADEYAAARTPNPCVMCNQWLKFGRLLDYASAVGVDEIATGHYARIERRPEGPALLRARHGEKDQSYVLFGLSRSILSRTRFPLGELTKDDVRAHARRLGLALHDKPESQDLCFTQGQSPAALLRRLRPDAFVPGEIRHEDGRLLGRHDGTVQFTIGQRRGLGVAVGEPVYVSNLDVATAAVTVAPAESLKCRTLRASRLAWPGDAPTGPFRADARIRYNHLAAPAWITPCAEGHARVEFDQPQWAITPGQAVVFYRGDEVLGGGWIEAAG